MTKNTNMEALETTTTATTDKEEKQMMANLNDYLNKKDDITTKAEGVLRAAESAFRMKRSTQGFLDAQELAPEFSKLLKDAVPEEMLAHGINVILVAKIPEGLETFEGDRLVIACGENPKHNPKIFVWNVYPNVCWVHVKSMEKLEKPAKTMIEKFVDFFGIRVPDMPEDVARQLFEAAWDGKEITLCIHPNAKAVARKADEDKKSKTPIGRFLLQEPEANGSYVPSMPIAYQMGNRIYVSIPNTQYGCMKTFYSNPKRREE